MNNKGIEAVADSIRSLSIDAIEKANSGHPGLPLGCAELAAVLYGELLKHNPADPKWVDRDRFMLSAGHGSMLLYSILHVSGYNVSIDDIKQFRQVGSKCPGHPEYGQTEGVENTSGPLGQGVSMAVGSAIAETMLAARFNTAKHTVVDHYTYSLVGEGCLMEGVSSEASSLAGHLKLGKLIVFYDENKITIDGCTDITFTDDIAGRYESYGWQVLKGSMYNIEEIESLVKKAKMCSDKPSLIMLKSVIGKGAPKQGTASVHGEPLGPEGVIEAKKALALPVNKEFYVIPAAYEYFAAKKPSFAALEAAWKKEFDAWSIENPDLRKQWDAFYSGKSTGTCLEPEYKTGEKIATRAAGGRMLNTICSRYENFVGGSADLTGPNNTKVVHDDGTYTPENRKGRTIEFGIREFAMSAVCSGILLHGGLRTYCATFLVFSDYLRPSLRVAALMKINPVYIFTHDSIFTGEDGPTHQPVETLNALRLIPNVQVLRPGDAEETNAAWQIAVESKDHPVCLVLTRQGLAVYKKDDPDWKNTIKNGAYIVKVEENPEITILASGSEVSLSLEACKKTSKKIRVVSIIDRELFKKQPEIMRERIIGKPHRIVTVEAGTTAGWEFFATSPADMFGINNFGISGPGDKVAESLGFTSKNLTSLLNR
jgi:transketolase